MGTENNWLNLHAGVVHIGIGGVETTTWEAFDHNYEMTLIFGVKI